MQITIDIDNDTLASLAVAAMKDSVSLDAYIATAVTELAKVINEQATDPEEQQAIKDTTVVNSSAPAEDPIITPTANQKVGGEGAPLIAKRSSGWKL
ncbi:hypothetical protein OAU81_00440 [bacterium]|nr:hypothetical protein [bacterium]